MSLDKTVNLEEIAAMTEGYSAVMCRAVLSEAAMSSLRRNAAAINQEDMYEGVAEISNKKRFESDRIGYV